MDGKMAFFQLNNINERNNIKVNHYCDGVFDKKNQKKHELYNTGDCPQTIFINHDTNELHIIGGKLSSFHLRWNESTKQMVKVNKFRFSGIEGHKLIYVHNEWNKKLRSKLLLIGGYAKYPTIRSYNYCDHILCCDINDEYKGIQWKPLSSSDSSFVAGASSVNYNSTVIQLPKKLAYFGCVLYKNIFLIIMGGRTVKNKKMKDIWYLNLNSMKWTKSNIKCPIAARGFSAILTKNNETVHLFQNDSAKHFYVKINDIIPKFEVNTAENQQETVYQKEKLQKQSTTNLEIQRQEENVQINMKKVKSTSSVKSDESKPKGLLSPDQSEMYSKYMNFDERNHANHGSVGSFGGNVISPSGASSSNLSTTPIPMSYTAHNSILNDYADIQSRFDPRPTSQITTPTVNDTVNTPNSETVPNFDDQGDNDDIEEYQVDDEEDDINNLKPDENEQHIPVHSEAEKSQSKDEYVEMNSDNNNAPQNDENDSNDDNDEYDLEFDNDVDNEYITNTMILKKRPSAASPSKSKHKNDKNDKKEKNDENDKNKKKHKKKPIDHTTPLHREITRNEIDDNRFSCRIMYDWIYSFCGAQAVIGAADSGSRYDADRAPTGTVINTEPLPAANNHSFSDSEQ